MGIKKPQTPEKAEKAWTDKVMQNPPKWEARQHLRHINGGHYVIVGTPQQFRIEQTDEPAYAYRAWDEITRKEFGPTHIRTQAQTEDGRFVPLPSTYADLYGSDYSWACD